MARLDLIIDTGNSKRDVTALKGAVVGVGNEVDRTVTKTKKIGLAAKAGIAAAGVAATAFIKSSITDYRQFNAKLAETSTLIEGTPAEMAKIEAGAKDLVKVFGGSATDKVQAYYNAISAGATDLDQANRMVAQANKLAIGGVTDVNSAIDILTTSVNVYGEDVLGAGKASDILFTTVKNGKTTAEELAASLGKVLPVAASVGVGFEQVNASVATLTSNGLATAESVTGLKAAFSGILKPTSEAAKYAQSIGLEFNAAALESKGFAGFLEDVVEKTGGSTENMAKLFSSTEALGAVLSLTGDGMDKMNSNLDAMTNSAGATDEAYKKVADGLDQRLTVAMDKMRVAGLGVGEVALTVLVPAMEWLSNNTEILIPIIGGLAVGVAALGVAMLANPIGLFVVAVTALTAGAIALYQNWDVLVEKFPLLGTAADGVKTSFEAFKNIFSAVADTVVAVFTGDWPAAIEGLKGIFGGLFSYWDEMLGGLPSKFLQFGIDLVQGLINGIKQKFEEAKAAIAGMASSVIGTFKSITGINSPSKVFKQFGAWISEGLGIGISENAQLAVGATGEMADGVIAETETLADKMQSVLAEPLKAIINGTKTAKEAFGDMLKGIAEKLLNSGIDGLINSIFGGINIGGVGGGFDFGSLFSSIFGGFFANGGMPPMGKVSVVGERGPELFVPNTRGTIIPNHALGGAQGGGEFVVHINASSDFDARVETISGNASARVVREQLPNSMAGQAQNRSSQFNQVQQRNFGKMKAF